MDKIKEIKKMYRISGYNKQFIILFTIIIVAAIVEIILVPNIIKRTLNVYIPNGNITALILWGIIHLIVLSISCYVTLKHCNIRSILKIKIQRDLKEKVFSKMQEVKTEFYDENGTGVILQYLQTDIDEAGALFPEVVTEMCFMGLIRFSIIAIFLMFIDLKITLSILMLYIIGYFITLYFNKKTINVINKIRKINIELYSKINEGVQGFLTIKVLNIIDKKERELKEVLQEYNSSNNQLEKIVAMYNNIFSFIVSLSLVIIIYFGGISVSNGVLTYAEIMLLIDYSSSLGAEFNWFIKHLTNFNISFVAFSKILSFLELEETEKIEMGKNLEKINSIEFNNVRFSYTGYEENIKDFSLTLKQGEKLALIGRTGSGKTTVVNLLCRFYEPTKGEIRLNGENYLNYSIKSLRSKIGYVMQETCIFPDTIIDNIKYVNSNITEKEIQEIFKKLKLHDKIMSFRDGYNTNIFSNPDILSTGEKQMLNFARVMATNYDAVILDEVTSTLSYEAEMLVNNAIKEITKDKISIIIAHRLSTIKDCDKIIELKSGEKVYEKASKELINIVKDY